MKCLIEKCYAVSTWCEQALNIAQLCMGLHTASHSSCIISVYSPLHGPSEESEPVRSYACLNESFTSREDTAPS